MTLTPGPTVTTPAGPAELVDDSTKGQALVRLPNGRLVVFPATSVALVRSALFT